MKIALFGQYYQNSTAEIVQKVVTFLESNAITIAFEASFLASLKEKNIILFANERFIYDPKNKEIQNIQILGDVIRNLKLGGKEWN